MGSFSATQHSAGELGISLRDMRGDLQQARGARCDVERGCDAVGQAAGNALQQQAHARVVRVVPRDDPHLRTVAGLRKPSSHSAGLGIYVFENVKQRQAGQLHKGSAFVATALHTCKGKLGVFILT